MNRSSKRSRDDIEGTKGNRKGVSDDAKGGGGGGEDNMPGGR